MLNALVKQRALCVIATPAAIIRHLCAFSLFGWSRCFVYSSLW